MNPSRSLFILISAVCATIALQAPAEARYKAARPQWVDVAARAPYPVTQAPHARQRAFAHRRKPRSASLTPLDAAGAVPPTISGYRARPADPAPADSGLVTVETAAGIKIVVALNFAPKIEAVIADLVATGIHPKRIHCFARGGHVHHSLHYSGNACDFDFYRGCMGCSARWTRHIAAIVARHGLRNGCTFGDCGHIDAGLGVARRNVVRRRRVAYAETVHQLSSPANDP